MNIDRKYIETINRTYDFACRNHEKLMNARDIQVHYKAPYFWACIGDMEKAGIYCDLIEKKYLRKDGDFRTEDDFKGFSEFPCTVLNQYIYPNGWIVSGMQRLGRLDIARKGIEFILRFQDPKYGGFYYSFDATNKVINKKLMDSSSTSSAGMACLMCGYMENAILAGQFIISLIDKQPDFEKCFYSCMKNDGTLFTELEETDDPWEPNGRKQKCLSTEHDGATELTWLIGKPTKFLTRLYLATGNKIYLEYANKAFEFFHRLNDNAWTNYASCKTMWAGAELYRLTGMKKYKDTALRILDFYSETQCDSGAWVHHLWYADEAEQSFSWTADITFEFGAEISDVIFDLSGS